MKRIFYLSLLFLFALNTSAQINSVNGFQLPPYDTIRVFLVFAERTNTADYSDYKAGWLPGQMPDRADEFFDPVFTNYSNLEGYFTKYFYQMSFGDFIMIGDYYPSLVQIDESLGFQNSTVISYLNSLQGTDITTANGYSINSDSFDYWTSTSSGYPKTSAADNKIDMVIICWRNAWGDGNGSVSISNSSFTLKSKSGSNAIGKFGCYS